MKRIVSMILAVALVASCLFVLPVSATETDLFTYEQGGHWTQNVPMTSAEILAGDLLVNQKYVTYTAPTSDSDSATLVTTGNLNTYSGDKFSTAKGFKFTKEDGKRLVELTVELQLDNLDFFEKATDNVGFCFGMYPVINGTDFKTTLNGYTHLVIRRVGTDEYGVYYGYSWSTATSSTPYTKDTILEYKMSCELDGNTATLTEYGRAKGETVWNQIGTVTKEVDNPEITAFGLHEYTYPDSKVDTSTYPVKAKISNAQLTESIAGAQISDLSSKSYSSTAKVPVNIYLPEGTTEAKLLADGIEIADFSKNGGVTAGAYSGTLDLAKLNKVGEVTLTLSGKANGTAFTSSTKCTVVEPAKGSLNTELFTEPTASNGFASMDMDTAEFLNQTPTCTVSGATGVYSYDAESKSAAVYFYGTTEWKTDFIHFDELAFNNADTAELEIDMKVSVQPGALTSWSDYDQKDGTTALEAGKQLKYDKFQFNPIVDGTAVPTTSNRYSSGVYFRNKGYDGDATPTIGARRTTDDSIRANADGGVVDYKILITKSNGTIHYTQKYKVNGIWLTDASTGYNTVEGPAGKLTGLQLWMGNDNAAADNYVKWHLSDVTVTETVTSAQLREFQGYYTQYDTVPVEFYLPEGYQDAMILVDGTPVAVYEEADGDASGSYKANLDLSKLGKAGTVSVQLKGTMQSGTAFERQSEITVYAAMNNATVQKTITVDTLSGMQTGDTMKSFGLTTNGVFRDDMGVATDQSGNRRNFSQYILEVGADVDFTQIVPNVTFYGTKSPWSGSLNVPVIIGNSLNLPKGEYNLKFRVTTKHNSDTADGDTFKVAVYVDGCCYGVVESTLDGISMNDQYARTDFKFIAPDGYNNEKIGVSNLTYKQFNVFDAKTAVDGNAVTVTLNRAVTTDSVSNITLQTQDGTAITATTSLSADGKTVTLTAQNTLPADTQVVLGNDLKEADYTFTGHISGKDANESTIATWSERTYAEGDTITKPVTVSLNNTATTLQASDLKVWESGQSAIVKATVNTTATEGARLIVAAYSGTATPSLTECATIDIPAGSSLTNVVKTVQFDHAFDYVKVFLWDAFTGMNALYTTQSTL